MILYFSATGNTRYIAEELARLLGDEVLDLCPRIKAQNYETIYSEKPFVLCAPTYVCAPPAFFIRYIEAIELSGNPDVYFVSTSGGYSGISGAVMGRIIRKKGLHYMGWAEFKMPPNYIANKPHHLPEESVIRERIDQASQEAATVAEAIRARQTLKARHIWLLEHLIEAPLHPVLSRMGHRVDGFLASDHCISCGICAKSCPLNIIQMQDGKPVWRGTTCAHCMACIQNCPVEAIEFGSITQGRKRYRLKEYL